MTYRLSRLTRVICAAAVALAVTAAHPNLAPAADDKPVMDQKALDILAGMSKYIAGAKTLSVRAGVFYDQVRDSGIKIKGVALHHIYLDRPNTLQSKSHMDDDSRRRAWFDGEKLVVLFEKPNEYMSLPFKGSVDGLLEELISKHMAQLPLADLLFSDPAKTFGESIISAEYIGEKIVSGVKCHHLSFESTGADWQVWIEADDTPVPRRYVIVYVNEKGEPQFAARMDEWKLGDEAKPLFEPKLPEGAKEIPFGKPDKPE